MAKSLKTLCFYMVFDHPRTLFFDRYRTIPEKNNTPRWQPRLPPKSLHPDVRKPSYDRFPKYLRTSSTNFSEFEIIPFAINTTPSWNSLKETYKYIEVVIRFFQTLWIYKKKQKEFVITLLFSELFFNILSNKKCTYLKFKYIFSYFCYLSLVLGLKRLLILAKLLSLKVR